MKRVPLIFTCLLVLALNLSYAGDDYARISGWDFVNWKAGEATWDIFQRTFIGVRDDDPMDHAHWALYEPQISNKAHCFGMCLLSLAILKEDGHLGFCRPVCVYSGDFTKPKPFSGPDNPDLADAILMMNGHQFGHGMFNWIAEKFASGDIRNAMMAYNDVEYYLSMGDLPLISIIKEPGKGHAMVPYRCEKVNSNTWRIYVYDPNSPYRICSQYYDSDSNYIRIDKIAGGYSWSFLRDTQRWPPNTWWSGMSTTGKSAIFAYPYSLVLQPQRNPFELGAVLEDLNEFFVSGGGCITQIIDQRGKRFYKTDADDNPLESEIEDDPRMRMNNIMSFPYVGDAGEDLPDAYIIKDHTGDDLKIDVESRGESYQFYLTGGGRLIKVEAQPSPAGQDRLRIHKVNTRSEELSIESQRGSVTFSVELHRPLATAEASRTFKISNVRVTATSPIHLRLTEDLDALLIKSKKETVVCDLEITQTIGTEISKLEKKNINVSAAEWQKVSPSNWTKLKDAKIEVKQVESK